MADHLLAAVLALPAALLAHAVLLRVQHRLPLWLARVCGAQGGARAARLRGPVAIAMLAPKLAVWVAAALFASEQVMALAAARDDLAVLLRASLMAPLLESQGRRWTALELLELPLLLAVVWTAVGLLARALRWQLARASGMETGAGDTLATLVRYGLGALGALVVLQAWGFDVRSFALVGGVAGIGLGFGLQNVTSNFVSGLLLAFERPIRPGDFVRVGEFTGTVLRIGARSTEIRTQDHVSILVPNARFLEGEVVNWSHRNARCRVHVPVRVGVDADPARVRAALLGAAEGHPMVLADPRPDVGFAGLGEEAQRFDLEVWTDDPTAQGAIVSDLHYRIAASLRRHGLAAPRPQRELRLPELTRLLDALGRREFPDWDRAPAPPELPPADDAPPAVRPDAWPDGRLAALAARMRGADGVEVADRRHLLTVHPDCFVGSEAVSWLVAHEALTRAEAVVAGRRLLASGRVRHVLDEHDFEDARLFYRFAA